MEKLTASLRWIGRYLVWGFCGYEVLALGVEGRSIGHWVRPLSHWCHRYRRHPVGAPIAAGLFGWLFWHLFFEVDESFVKDHLDPVMVLVSPPC